MKTKEKRQYTAAMRYRTAVRLNRTDHSQYGNSGFIIRVLENRSEDRRNQWYDVLFENGVYGRFQEADLEQIELT